MERSVQLSSVSAMCECSLIKVARCRCSLERTSPSSMRVYICVCTRVCVRLCVRLLMLYSPEVAAESVRHRNIAYRFVIPPALVYSTAEIGN